MLRQIYGVFLLLCVAACRESMEDAGREQGYSGTEKHGDPIVVVNLFSKSDPAAQTPVVRRTLGDLDVPLRFSLKNDSGSDFHYYGAGRYGPTTDSIQCCPIRLYQEGALIPHTEQMEGAGLFPWNKRVLKPGEEIPYEVRLDSYGVDHKSGTLTEGRYELRIEYAQKSGDLPTDETDELLTPIDLDRAILLIDIVDDSSALRPLYVWLAVVAVAGGVLGLAWRSVRRAKGVPPSARGDP